MREIRGSGVRLANTQMWHWICAMLTFICLTLGVIGTIPEANAANEKSRNPTEVEVVMLTSAGFIPSKIQRPVGDFRLQVSSGLPVGNLSLEMQDASKKTVKTKAFTSMKGQRQRWIDDYSLTPGTYVLQVKEYPQFKLEIVVGK